MGHRRKKLARNEFERLHRQYCRRYGLNPATAEIPKEELIADAVFVQKEAEGDYPADRIETVLSAIFYSVFWSACYHGMDPKNAARFIGEAEATKPRKWKEPDPEELRQRKIKEDRILFARLRSMSNG